MKNKFDKALNKKEKKKKKKKKYTMGKVCTNYIILVPFLPIVWLFKTIPDYIFKKTIWNEKKAKKIITERIIKGGEIYKEKEAIQYGLNVWHPHWDSKIKYYDKIFAKKFREEITSYFIKEYTVKGFIKQVERSQWNDDIIYITFKKEK